MAQGTRIQVLPKLSRSNRAMPQCVMCSNKAQYFTLGDWYCEPCAFEVHGA